jgi:hypothetical protein
LSSLQQIFVGSGLLASSAVIHVLAVALSLPLFRLLAGFAPKGKRPLPRVVLFLLLTVGVMLAAHTVQIWMWAAIFLLISNLPDLETSFYFAAVTYTTLGYGDVVLDENARIVATFCAITGLLTFGISTAFLIGVLSRVLPDRLGDE